MERNRDLPVIVCLALYKSGYVGYYTGNGYAIEWKGVGNGYVKTKVARRDWTNWYRLPFIDYGDGTTTIPAATPVVETSVYELGARTLKKGCKGKVATALQKKLLALGYSLPKYCANGTLARRLKKL